MNSWAQLKILDCLCSGCSTKSKDKMMNHRGEGDSKKESTRKGCTKQEWAVLQSRLIPSLLPVCWTGGGDTAISLLKLLWNHIFSPARQAAMPRDSNLLSFTLPTHPHTVDPRDSPSQLVMGMTLRKTRPCANPSCSLNYTDQGRPALVQPDLQLWGTLWSPHWAGQALVAACQQWLY